MSFSIQIIYAELYIN